ncbi:hypothetical protein [Vreelandella populi]|nr:hypothetical protein [Halomonas populi]
MSRSIEISAPARTIDSILERVGRVSGVVSLSRQKGVSLPAKLGKVEISG